MIYDGCSYGLIQLLTCENVGINDLVWTYDSQYIITACDDKKIHIWNIYKNEIIRFLEGHKDSVICLSINLQTNMLISGSLDTVIKMWNIKNGKCMRNFYGHSDGISSINLNRDGTMILSSSFDGITRIWDTLSGCCLKTIINENNIENKGFSTFLGDQKYILISTMNNEIELWNYELNEIKRRYTGHTCNSLVINFCLCNDNRYLASGSEDNNVYIWDLDNCKIMQILKGHLGSVICVDNSNDKLLSCGLDKSIKIWTRK